MRKKRHCHRFGITRPAHRQQPAQQPLMTAMDSVKNTNCQTNPVDAVTSESIN
jgi:hypothetical protein